MREKYFCPNCRAVIICGEKFCGNCGTALRWVIPQTFSDSLSHDSQDTAIQQSSRDDGGNRQGKSSAVGTMAPLNAEIAKLLAEFEKHLKDQYVKQTGPDNQAPAGSN